MLCEDIGFSYKKFQMLGQIKWVPHCTIALTGDDGEEAFYLASNLLLHEFKKIAGQFVSIGLVKITFPVEEVYTVAMKQ